MSGLDDLEDQAEKRRRTRTPPPPRNPHGPKTPTDEAGGAPLPRAGDAPAEQAAEAARVVVRPPSTPQEVVAYLDSFTALTQPLATATDLTAQEREIRTQYEQAAAGAELGFIIEGMVAKWTKAGELYRDEFERFEDYCTANDRSIRRINQLMQVAPLGLHILRRLGKNFSRLRLNESHAHHLLPLAERAGPDAAVVVYEALLRADQRITGRLIRAVLARLPADRWDPDEAASIIKAFLAEDVRVLPADRSQAAVGVPIETEIGRIQQTERRATRLARQQPDWARRIATELEQAAQRIRAELEQP
jgi:hypothetical protein